VLRDDWDGSPALAGVDRLPSRAQPGVRLADPGGVRRAVPGRRPVVGRAGVPTCVGAKSGIQNSGAAAPEAGAARARTWKGLEMRRGPSTVCGWASSQSMSGDVLLSHTVSRAVPSALKGLASGFGMEPGVSLSPWSP
jgi:hypothetical protein